MELDLMLEKMWHDYSALNPQAGVIHSLFGKRGEIVLNDHVAFRTFDHPAVNIEVMARPFLQSGFMFEGEYEFPFQHLRAVHMRHANPRYPKVFISELICSKLPMGLQSLILSLLNQIPSASFQDPTLCFMGRLWNLTRVEYESLGRVSEYAAWLSAFGFRVNHFTVLVNALQTFKSLSELNRFLMNTGFSLNLDGGEIKGSPQVYLEQSSTLASPVLTEFSDGFLEIPGCYYEFALRYVMPDGKIFQGFVAKNAARIFTSTHRQEK